MRETESVIRTSDIVRLSLGGGIFAAALSGTLGHFAGWGSSDTRDVIWSLVGFFVVLAILLLDRRKTRRRAKARTIQVEHTA